MSWMKRLGGRLPDFEDVVRRFPITVIVMAIATIWLVVEIHMDEFRSGREYVFGGFIFAGYAALIGHLMAEARGWASVKSAILALLLAAPAFLLSAFGESLNFNVVLAVGGAILFLGNAAAWRKSRHDPAVWNFTQKLWTGAIFAAVGTGIFAAGMVIISEAVKALFGFNLEDLTIKTLLPIGLLFLAPVYWLGTLPRYGEAEDVDELSFEARALSFLGTWMLAPLVIIYALIILAYGAKVLIQWELPKGEIALLVSPFLGVGMLVWLMLEPKVLKESGFVQFYRAAWHWIMLLAAVLLGVAVFVRIRAFGFTPERFFLALVVVWALVQSLWFTVLPKLRRDIRFPTALAAGLLVFGAFGAKPLSIQSQFQRGVKAKAELANFDAASVRNNPEAARVFRGALSYLIKANAETRFEALLPDYDMPSYAYGTQWDVILKSLNLDEVEEAGQSLGIGYRLRAEAPILIPEGSSFYGSYELNLSSNNRNKNSDIAPYLVSQDGFEVSFDVEGQIFDVDFNSIFDGLNFETDGDKNDQKYIPAQSILTASGSEIKLIILSGYYTDYGRSRESNANLEVAFIVPN